jgi:hypothetical protein
MNPDMVLVNVREQFVSNKSEHMAKLTISEAIRQSGVGRTQFYSKYIKLGLISVSVSNGKKFIDTSELLRVFGELKGKQTSNSSEQTEENSTEQAVVNNFEQTEQIRLLQVQLTEAKQREEFYQSQIINLTNRLEPPKYQNPIVKWWRGLGK